MLAIDSLPRHTTRRTTASHRRPSRVATVMAVAALTLAACGSDDEGGAAADPADGATTEVETSSTTTSVAVAGGAASADTGTVAPTTDAPATTPAPAESTTTASPETTTTTTTTEPPVAGDCIVGTWSLRSQEFLDEIVSSLPADLTGGQLVDWDYVSGEYLITFGADGSTRGQRIAWTHRIATPEGALVTTIDSDEPGTYSVDGDQISVTAEGGDSTVRLQVEVGGQLQDLPIGGTQTVGTDAIAGGGTYTCDGDVLSLLLLDLPDAPPNGFDATLDRQS